MASAQWGAGHSIVSRHRGPSLLTQIGAWWFRCAVAFVFVESCLGRSGFFLSFGFYAGDFIIAAPRPCPAPSPARSRSRDPPRRRIWRRTDRPEILITVYGVEGRHKNASTYNEL